MKHFLFWVLVVTHMSSSKSDGSWASTKYWNIFFLIKMQHVEGLMSSDTNKYQGMTVVEKNPVRTDVKEERLVSRSK